MKQPSYYAIISAEITALLNMNGECFATNRYFSELYGKSVVTISKWISELTANGYLSTTYTYKEGTKEIDRRYIRILKGGIKEKDREGIKEKFKDNNTKVNNNITYSNNKARFKKPDVNEIADYCLERKNGIDAETFFDFYESKNWFIGKSKMKSWKACVRTWEKRQNKNVKGMSKVHMHLNSHLQAKELLKKQRQ